jgi:hypothetical protein
LHLPDGDGEIVERHRVAGIERERFAIGGFGFVQPAEIAQRRAQIVEGAGKSGVELDRFAILRQCFVELSLGAQGIAEIAVSGGKIRASSIARWCRAADSSNSPRP